MCQLIYFSVYERDFIFAERQNLKFTGEDLANFLRIRVFVTGQLDQQVKFVAGQIAFQARNCLLTSHYFEPCSYKSVCSSLQLTFLRRSEFSYWRSSQMLSK